MTIQELIEQIKTFEGFRALAYDDLQPNIVLKYSTQLKGTLTIGYGRTENVYIGEVTTIEKETKWLQNHVTNVYNTVCKSLSQFKLNANENQKLALTDFCYNCGYSNFLKLLNFGKRTLFEIGETIPEYNKSKGIVLQGLVKRRKFEYDLFFSNSEQPKKEKPKKENVSSETWNINYKYNSHDVQELCNKIIKDNNLPYEPLVIDGILGEKSTDLIFTLLYKGYGYL